MAVIESGATTDLLTIDPTAKAARVILYGPDGNPLVFRSDIGRGALAVAVRQSSAAAVGSVVWAVRNTHATRMVYITSIRLMCAFDGTGVATLMRYELIRGTTNSSISGGAAVTPLIKDSTVGQAPDVDCRVLDTGLTLNGVALGSAFAHIMQGRVTPSATAQSAGSRHLFDYSIPIRLEYQAVLAIRVGPTLGVSTGTAVVGDMLLGSVEFQEG